ncbi:LysM peptidoglycan-binding domain-containing protein [Rhizobium deserti]|uniref:LysM peptidoglycan-binding domain-containing protein n=1 Tax=Rhizobium deserti TaxID=2547961 RepID=A0A4R5UJT0_9HYPH|nr:LysM peptidoglycan-binding domain-containing protein [Rhizobium deserti]TDK37137.1 LysM peptidoglycan-binding domain-containing protein [Rhizobium deserti]
MMKNRAGWLALIVLAIASLLMVFFVMPRINQGSKPLGEAINAAGDAVKDAVNEGKQATQSAEAPKTAQPGSNQPETREQAAVSPAPSQDQPAAPQPSAAQPAIAQQTPSPANPSSTSQSSASQSSASPGQPQAAATQSGASQAAAQNTAQGAPLTPSFDVLRVEPDGSTVIAGRASPHSTLEVTDGNSVVAKVDVGPSGDFAAVLDNPLPPGDHQLVLKATAKDGKSTTSEETATVSVPVNQKSGKLLAMVTTPGKASRLIATPTPTTAAAGADQSAAPAQAGPAVSPPAGSADIASAAPNVAAASSSAPTTTPATGAGAAGAPAAAGAAELQVTAVELEGSKIFIAGVSKRGTAVRGLADGKPIGQTQTGSDGHFVIEGTADLTIGDHRISVESLNGASQALVRVEVPFNRPAGEQVAAVAAPVVSTPMAAVDGGSFDTLRNDTVRAFNILQRLYASGKLPSLEEMVAARSATSIALKSLSEYRLPAGASVSARMLAETTTRDAGTAVAALDALAPDVASVGLALKEMSRLVARAVGPVVAQQIEGTEQVAAAEPAPAVNADGARTIQQAPLTQSDRGAVIIRRGDTLWQISRRVYGQGVRYTTIYLANEDQINNPDVIQPGQIFGVPEEFRPDAEELHRQRLQHRKG